MGGPVRVIVDPDTVPERTVFSVQSVGLPELLTLVEGVVPPDMALVGGVRVTAEPQLNHSVHLAFPVNPSTLNLPPGMAPEDVPFTIAQPEVIDGTQVFNVVEKATFKDWQAPHGITAIRWGDSTCTTAAGRPDRHRAVHGVRGVKNGGGYRRDRDRRARGHEAKELRDRRRCGGPQLRSRARRDRVRLFPGPKRRSKSGGIRDPRERAGFYAIQVPIQGPLDVVARCRRSAFVFLGKLP